MDKENKCNCNDECSCEDNCNCNETTKCCETCNCDVEHPPSDTKEKKKSMFSKKDKVKELEEKVNELVDKELRQKAEFINYRKRKEDETSRMLKYAHEDIVKELLPAIDNFERAIDMDDDNLEDEVSKFLSGFKMIYCNLNSILEKYGVTEIEALNTLFDPNIHQAVLTEKKDGVASGMVIEVLQKGYKLKDRVIRPTMVKVSE